MLGGRTLLLFPWWVYICIIGIIFCLYKIITTTKEEEKIDQSFIEKEGQIFMERINEERARRIELKKD
jgi:hypothetical protein